MIDIAREIASVQRQVGENRTAEGATVRSVRVPLFELMDHGGQNRAFRVPATK